MIQPWESDIAKKAKPGNLSLSGESFVKTFKPRKLSLSITRVPRNAAMHILIAGNLLLILIAINLHWVVMFQIWKP